MESIFFFKFLKEVIGVFFESTFVSCEENNFVLISVRSYCLLSMLQPSEIKYILCVIHLVFGYLLIMRVIVPVAEVSFGLLFQYSKNDCINFTIKIF